MFWRKFELSIFMYHLIFVGFESLSIHGYRLR